MKNLLPIFVFLFLTQGIAYARSVLLSWNDNSENEDGFLIERTLSEDCAAGWEVIAYVGVNQTSLLDVHIPGACYRVTAYNVYGFSGSSEIAKTH